MIYAMDKPKDCRYCYYWQSEEKGCLLGEKNCYYLLRPGKNKKKNPCDGCPYGRINPCVGFCMKEILKKRGKENG